MIANCDVYIGDSSNSLIHVTPDLVLSCSFIESLSTLPNGKVEIKCPTPSIDKLFTMPSNIPITIVLSSFEQGSSANSDTIKTFKGSIIRHYSSEGVDKFVKYVIEFISAGTNLSYLNVLSGKAISDTSTGAIRTLASSVNANVSLLTSTSTNDYMKWIVVHKNLVCAIDQILNHSYVSDSSNDAVVVSYLSDNSITINTLKNSLNSESSITYFYGKKKIDIVNTANTQGNVKYYTYYDYKQMAITGTKQIPATSASVEVKAPSKAQNSQEKNVLGVSPLPDKDDTGITGMNDTVLSSKKVIYSNNPNVHDNYSIAPSIRDSIFAAYAHKLTLYAAGESAVNTGDSINVIVPVIGTQNSNDSSTYYSQAFSGKYFVYSKIYYYGNGRRFEVQLELMKTTMNVDSGYFSRFGVSKDSIR